MNIISLVFCKVLLTRMHIIFFLLVFHEIMSYTYLYVRYVLIY